MLQSDKSIFPRMRIPEGTPTTRNVISHNITKWTQSGKISMERDGFESMFVEKMEKLGEKVGVKISGLTEQPRRRKSLEKGICVWTGKE